MAASTRALAALALATAMLLGATFPALAWESRVEGLPGPVGDTTAYLIDHDAAGWHLTTHGPRLQHHFTGVLTTDGRFTDVQLRHPEHPDGVRLLDGGHELRINFYTFDYTDGVDFRVDGGTRLTFRLEVDDHLIAPAHIYLGAAGRHPERNPFTIGR
ncbi:MAG TPA: hypothetical protein VFE37_22630 [Chloroflexota bacterium]|nr:hypothetical protein [Chloroflexota bacterium]